MKINGVSIGDGHAPYIVAEIGAGHCGSLDSALDLILDARRGGANAVKLQTYTPESMTIDHSGPAFQVEGGPWGGKNLFDLYRKAHTPREWHERLFDEARRLDLTIFSTPFSPGDVDFLEGLGCPAYKVASCEIAHFELLDAIRETKKPVILSTGMASLQEIKQAVDTLYGREVAILHCVSGYPTPIDEANVWRVRELRSNFPHRVVGYSDHTKGSTSAIAAVALGAAIVEKHIGDRTSLDGEFAENSVYIGGFIARVREAWRAMRDVRPQSEDPTRRLRRSIYVVADIAEGEALTRENIAVIRPAGGLDPSEFASALGKKTNCALKRGTPLLAETFE